MKSEEVSTRDICNEPDEELAEKPSEESVSQQASESDKDETEQPSEELIEDTTWDRIVKHAFQSSSEIENDLTEQTSKESYEGPLEESLPASLSESDSDDNEFQNSKEKKRLLDVTAGDTALLPVHPSRKKCKQEESIETELNIGYTPTDIHDESGSPKVFVNAENTSEQQDHTGSSGKLRRSRDEQPEDGEEEGKGDRKSKRRRTKWALEDSQLKMMGPIQLPDFTKDVTGADSDPKIWELKMKLLEINRKLQESEIHYDRLKEEISCSPYPVNEKLGIGMNSREISYREKLIQERQNIILKLIQKNPVFKPPPDFKPSKLYKKLYLPLKEYPGHNFIGLIIGPFGNTHKRMEKETGARIVIRGNGSSMKRRAHQKPDPSDNDDLHVLVEADNQTSLDAAVKMVEKLLNPVDGRINKHKLSQLKELAVLKGMVKDERLCRNGGERGCKQYVRPSRKSTSEIDLCEICQCSSHPSTSCAFAASSPVSNVDHQVHRYPDFGSGGLTFGASTVSRITELGHGDYRLFPSPSYGHFSLPGVSSTPTPTPTPRSCEREQKQYNYPSQKASFEISLCDICRSSSHQATNCAVAASTPISNLAHQCHSFTDFGRGGLTFGASTIPGIIDVGHNKCKLSTSPSYGHFSPPGVSPIPNTGNKYGNEVDNRDIYVGYLPQTLDDNQLRDMLSHFGMIVAAKVIKDRSTGLSKGFGIVRFDDPVSAEAAAAHVQGQKIDGNTLLVRGISCSQNVGSSGITSFRSTRGLYQWF